MKYGRLAEVIEAKDHILVLDLIDKRIVFCNYDNVYVFITIFL